MRFRKKPVVIEARQFGGWDDYLPLVDWMREHGQEPSYSTPNMIIPTLEGDHVACPGDWIIKGVAGEFYPCKPDIFEATYDKVDDA